ncbi:MAG TPA: diacylglycerol kinase family protein [Anaerolineaceae bacterium]|nr:diacylglycerol kinase family protein [Anaerolineaceae bacterium]
MRSRPRRTRGQSPYVGCAGRNIDGLRQSDHRPDRIKSAFSIHAPLAWKSSILSHSAVQPFFNSRIHSFRSAFSGWWYVIRTQKNAWIHAIATICVVSMAIWLGLSLRDWAVLLLTISSVWTAEFLNTALEAVVDLASPQRHPLAKVGKDVGAAAVLITAASAVIIGFLIMGPPLLLRLQPFFSTR